MKHEENGFYYGQNLDTHQKIICERSKLKSPNGFIFGTSGSGRVETARREVAQIIKHANNEVVILDCDGEYERSGLKYGVKNDMFIDLKGEITQFNLTADDDAYHINLMDLVLDGSNNEISNKCDMVTAFFEVFIKRPLSQSEKNIIHDAVKTVLAPFVEELKRNNLNFSPENNPTLSDVLLFLEMTHHDETEENEFLKLVLREKRDYFKAFEYHTNIPDGKAIEIKWHGMSCKLEVMTYVVCVDYVRNKMLLNNVSEQRKNIYVYWDDVHLVLNDKPYNKTLIKILGELFRQSRELNCIHTATSEDFAEIYSASKEIFNQFGLLRILRQSPASRELIQKTYQFSNDEMKWLKNQLCRIGLFYKTDEAPIPFRLEE